MKIPEAHICDAEDCTEDAWYRITHEILREPTIAGHMRYGLEWGRTQPMVFEFCEIHATDFSIGGRGAWTTPPRLKAGFPEAEVPKKCGCGHPPHFGLVCGYPLNMTVPGISGVFNCECEG